jgi:Rps23 Pro-64 3,4-dihydroxylase Tpa1-like proline 4-hydroxylase
MELKSIVNKKYLKNKENLKKEFKSNKPFSYLELDKFFSNQFIEKAINSLSKERFEIKESDLFKFKQTNDFQSSESKELQGLRELLKSDEFINYLQEITGIELKKDKIDIHGTLYENTDFLLCHDDKLDTRKIAFMIYLSDFKESDGGTLDLYRSNNKKPTKISKKITPKFNKFAFFKVSEISFHEVSEIVVDKQRLAIGGWFHAK